jgi:glycine betaine/proline transport system substrate-binding protein
MEALIGRGWRVLAAFAALLTTALALSACGGSGSSGSATAATSKGITVKAAQFTWAAAAVTNAILQDVASAHPELGVARIQSKTLDPAPAWVGAARGDVDLLTEVALPNQQPLYEKAKSRIDLVSKTYGGAGQGWFVPSYAVAPGGPLAGLTSVTQLDKYKSALGGKLYDGAPGWISTQQNDQRLKGYGVGFQHVTSSEAAELAQLKRAYDAKRPILLYLYHPHWVFAHYKLTQLEEPNAYKPDCFTSGNGACAMAPYAAWTAASKDLAKKAPRFVAMLERFRIPIADMEQMLKAVSQDHEAPAAVAKRWVDQHKSAIDAWTASP